MVIEPGVLGRLVNLEELHMDYSFDQWEAEDEETPSNASLGELKNMKKLSTLGIAIPHCTILPRDLPFGKLNKHKIQIGDVWKWSGEYKEISILKLKEVSRDLLHEEWVQRCFRKTEDLHLDGLQDGSDSIHDLCAEGFPELKQLHVQNSPSFKYVVPSLGSAQCTAFMKLESLLLKNLNSLEKICLGDISSESFSKLKIVKAESCGEIKYLFDLSMTRIFLQLEEIEISKCSLMQQIFIGAKADDRKGDEEVHDDSKGKSSNLRKLTLRKLPEMTSFCKTRDHLDVFFDAQQVSLPWLESLTLLELPKLKEIWNSGFPSYVRNLKFLKVEECPILSSIIPSNLLAKLQNLEAITIEGCKLIKEVFDLEGLTDNGKVEILSRLTRLTLSDLPSLGSIWNKNPRRSSCFQQLSVLKVQNCENLRFLYSSFMAKALWQIKEIEIVNCKLMEEIIDAHEEESEKAATIDTLEFPLLTSLSLEELPNIKTFTSGKYRIHFPSLTKLRISGCPKMMNFSSFQGKPQSMTSNTGLQQSFGRINSELSLPVFFNRLVSFPSLEELTLSSLRGLRRIWPNELPEKSFCGLASIKVTNCEFLSHIFPSTLIESLRSLTMIEVVNCTSLEALTEHVAVGVDKSNGLRCLFTNDTARTLDELEMLNISGCHNMHKVVAAQEDEEGKLKTVKFSRLRTLKLCSLKSLISFSSGSCAYEFPSLEEFIVEDCEAVEVIIGDASCIKREDDVQAQQPLLLVEKVELPNLESMKVSHMANMEKIWVGEYASNAFSKLKTLIVEYCGKLSFIFPSVAILVRFQNLEKLTVTDCDSLEVVFPVQELNVNEACSPSSFQLKEINLERLPKVEHVWSGQYPRGTLAFECLRCFKAVDCPSLKSIFPRSVARNSMQLEELIIHDSGVEEIIVEEEDGGAEIREGDHYFPRLTKLHLIALFQLRSFCRNSHTFTWPLLTNLGVAACGDMRLFSFSDEIRSCQGCSTSKSQPAIFSAEKVIPRLEVLTLTPEDVAMMQHYTFRDLKQLELSFFYGEDEAFPSEFLLHRFPNLEILHVAMASLEEIFPEDPSEQGGASLQALKNLKILWLFNLDNLRQVWKDGSLMAVLLRQIEVLALWHCSSLSIVLPSPISIQRLTQLELKNCTGLVHMGTCSAVTSLAHLSLLNLIDCGKMEDVVVDDGNGVEKISFPKLQQLTLDGLPSLQSFSPTNCAFRFPSLVHIIVKQCPKMNTFCMGALTTPCLDKVRLSLESDEWRWEDDLNTTIQTLSR